MTNNARLETFKYKSVHGKDSLYIKIYADNRDYIIKVGEKTWNEITSMITNTNTTTTLNQTKK